MNKVIKFSFLFLIYGLLVTHVYAITPPSSLVFSRNLSIPMQGNDVTNLQQFLITNEYLAISEPTGYFGKMTFSAVKSWQKDIGLPSTGYFGPLSRVQIQLSSSLSFLDITNNISNKGSISGARRLLATLYFTQTPTCPTTIPTGSFLGCYYDNSDLTGFIGSGNENVINFNFGTSSPDSSIGEDTFSARWEGDFTFQAGPYNFSVIGDDGVRLYIDNVLVINKWIPQYPTAYTSNQNMTEGTHRIKLEYYEKTGGAVAKLSWAKIEAPSPAPSPTPSVIPPSSPSIPPVVPSTPVIPAPTPEPTPTPVIPVIPTPIPEPTPITPTPQPVLTKFTIGQRVTATANIRVRDIGSLVSTILTTENMGALGTVISGPISQGGYAWWKINYDSGAVGWSTDDFLITTTLPIQNPTPTPSCPTTVPSNSFLGCYYNNNNLTNFVLSRIDNSINFNFGLGSPDVSIGADTFSTRWEGDFVFEAGNYTFSATGDDGIRLYIDNNLVINKWIDQPPTTYTNTYSMSAGTHRIKFESYDSGGGAVAKLSWVKVVSPVTPAPTAPVVPSTPSTPISTTTPTVSSSNKAIGFSVANYLLLLDSVKMDQELAAMEALGVKWLRFDMQWRSVQHRTDPTYYDWVAIDRLVAAATKHNIKILGILGFAPTWAYSSTCPTNIHCPPADPTAFVTFAKKAVQRYSPKGVSHWEIWNEPNNAIFWGPKTDCSAYTNLLKLAYTAIKEADPNATVITGGLAPEPNDGINTAPIDFLKCIYANGGKNYFDAVGSHPYTFPIVPSSNFSHAWAEMSKTNPSLRSIMISNGDVNKKIWLTEFGAPTNGPDSRWYISETKQSEMMIDAINLYKTYDWAGPLFFYTFKDLGTSQSTMENFFGITRFDSSLKSGHSTLKDIIIKGL